MDIKSKRYKKPVFITAVSYTHLVYDIRHLGRKKTEALAERLREINPYLDLEVCDCKMKAENARGMLAGYPYICEAFDDPEAKAMLAEQVLLGLPQAYLCLLYTSRCV